MSEGIRVKALFIRLPEDKPTDMGDLIQIARTEGMRVLKEKKVNVVDILKYDSHSYIVLVVPKKSGCSKAQVVEEKFGGK